MDVELTVEESNALENALRTYCSDLRMEIADTDNAEYRRGLREERALLESVIAKLDRAAASSTERDVEGRTVVRVVGVWVS
ncbi:MAG TPA: hypothetical protein VF183_01755 [Acidimicrobiales bacterium]